jgi:hypothetical protein
MGKTLAELFVVINGKSDNLISELKKVTGSVKNTESEITKIAGPLKSLLPAVTVAGVVTGLGMMMTKAAEFGETMALAAQKTGLSVEYLQKLNYIAKTNNSSIEGLENAMKKLNTALSDAFAGDKAATDAFAKLGLSLESLRNMSQDERFTIVAQKIAQIKDPAEKSAMAVQMFGKAGADLIPVIDAMQGMKDLRFPTLSKEEIDALNKAKESTEKLTYAWEMLQAKFASALWPNLSPLIDMLSEATGKVGELLNAWNNLDPAFRQIFIAANGPWATPLQMITPKKHALGGIVTSPHVGMVGEAGPEAIIPLDRMGAMGIFIL